MPKAKATTTPNADLRRKTRTLAVLFGDQLDARYPSSLGLDKDEDVIVMMEVSSASRQPASSFLRTVTFLSAMRHFARALADDGWRVDYVELGDDANTQAFGSEIRRAIDRLEPRTIKAIQPGSHALAEELETACEGVELDVIDDPHFLCTINDFNEWAHGRKSLTLEYFYRGMRKRLGILMDGSEPVGGSWNFDKENRKSFKKAPDPPPLREFEPDELTRRVIEDVGAALPELPGRRGRWLWPVTRDDALEALDDFVSNRLRFFGDYQDAMWTGEHTLYHSVISAPLNLKLLNPREVCDAVIRAYEKGAAPINAVEGFIRQIIGWREFIRGVYFHEGADYERRNGLRQYGELPAFYWSGETDMRCMHHALESVLETAYGHHIARLMVTGNFALISGVHPGAVNDWYLGMYADGVEWVTAPNTIGMAMHADHAVVGTKPYAASGKYISRMSNYCKKCPYDVNKRSGDDACPFNVFYWDFLNRNADTFKSNNRMSMILKNLERMDADELHQITVSAKRLRKAFGIGAISR